MPDEKQTLVELMRKASELVGLSIKTGAAAPAREAIALMDKVIAGDYHQEEVQKEHAEPKSKTTSRKPRKSQAKKSRR